MKIQIAKRINISWDIYMQNCMFLNFALIAIIIYKYNFFFAESCSMNVYRKFSLNRVVWEMAITMSKRSHKTLQIWVFSPVILPHNICKFCRNFLSSSSLNIKFSQKCKGYDPTKYGVSDLPHVWQTSVRQFLTKLWPSKVCNINCKISNYCKKI